MSLRQLVVITFIALTVGAASAQASDAKLRAALQQQHAEQSTLFQVNLAAMDLPTTMIVGGEEVELSDSRFAFTVSLQRGWSNFAHYCGGSLISRSYVLTAGHCVKSSKPDRVQIGNYDLENPNAGVIRRVRRVVLHPELLGLLNDVALLELDAPVDTISPVHLSLVPHATPFEEVGQMLDVVGWGYTAEGSGKVVDRLRRVGVPIVSQARCSVSYSGIDTRRLCAGYDTAGKDSCGGDSGGPLLYTDPSTGRITQVGIVSYGHGCARAGYYGVYARPSAFIDFIRDTLADGGEGLHDADRTTASPTASPTQRPTPFVADTPHEQSEFEYCQRYQRITGCHNHKREGRCYWNGADEMNEDFERGTCLPVFMKPTQAPTVPTPAPTIFLPPTDAAVENELLFCRTTRKQKCLANAREKRCFWNDRSDAFLDVQYLKNQCLPDFFRRLASLSASGGDDI